MPKDDESGGSRWERHFANRSLRVAEHAGKDFVAIVREIESSKRRLRVVECEKLNGSDLRHIGPILNLSSRVTSAPSRYKMGRIPSLM